MCMDKMRFLAMMVLGFCVSTRAMGDKTFSQLDDKEWPALGGYVAAYQDEQCFSDDSQEDDWHPGFSYLQAIVGGRVVKKGSRIIFPHFSDEGSYYSLPAKGMKKFWMEEAEPVLNYEFEDAGEQYRHDMLISFFRTNSDLVSYEDAKGAGEVSCNLLKHVCRNVSIDSCERYNQVIAAIKSNREKVRNIVRNGDIASLMRKQQEHCTGRKIVRSRKQESVEGVTFLHLTELPIHELFWVIRRGKELIPFVNLDALEDADAGMHG